MIENRPNPLLQPFEYQKWKIIGEEIRVKNRTDVAKKTRGIWSDFILRYTKSTIGLIGIILLFILIVGAIIIPFFSPDPNDININDKYLSFMQKDSHGTTHIFGTDSLGRDLWVRLWVGLRFSLKLALMVTLVDVLIGVSLGVLMGKYSKFDRVMQYFIKILTNLPTIIVMILVVILFGASFWTLTFSLTVTGWTGMALQIRAQSKRIVVAEWNTASEILGTPGRKQLLSLVPHILPMLVTQLISTIPSAIISETGMAFIGLSIIDAPTLGNLISDGTSIITLFPRYTIIPSTILILIVSSVQFIGLTTQKTLRRTR